MRISEQPNTGIVQSVDRALALLEALAESSGGARLSDVARTLNLAPSTAHRLLTTLQLRGFAQHEASTGKWVVGHRAFSVGETFAQHENLVVPARPFLRRLRDLTRETSNLGILEQEETVTIAQAESREVKRAIAPTGGRVPILNSGMGKAIIATWPDNAVETLVMRHGLRPMTSHSLTSLEAVMEEMEAIRERGYAVDNEEFVMGMRCVACVVRSSKSDPVAAISVSGLAARVTSERVPEFAEIVRKMADELSTTLSGSAGDTPPGKH